MLVVMRKTQLVEMTSTSCKKSLHLSGEVAKRSFDGGVVSLPQSASLTAADGGGLPLSLRDISLTLCGNLPSSEGAKDDLSLI